MLNNRKFNEMAIRELLAFSTENVALRGFQEYLSGAPG